MSAVVTQYVIKSMIEAEAKYEKYALSNQVMGKLTLA